MPGTTTLEREQTDADEATQAQLDAEMEEHIKKTEERLRTAKAKELADATLKAVNEVMHSFESNIMAPHALLSKALTRGHHQAAADMVADVEVYYAKFLQDVMDVKAKLLAPEIAAAAALPQPPVAAPAAKPAV